MVYMFDFLQILSTYPSIQLLHTVLKYLEVLHLPHLLRWPGHKAESLAEASRRGPRKPTLQEALLCLFSSCF